MLFIVFLFGQSSVEPKRNEVVSERHSNRLKKLVLVFEGEGLDEVLVAKYGFYENGLKSFIQSYKDNVLDGQSTEWYENGTKKSEIFYKSNQPSGELRMWHPNGQLRSIGNALNGKGTGEYKEFNDQGEIIAEGVYRDDKKHDKWIEIDYRGNKLKEYIVWQKEWKLDQNRL